MSAVARFDPVVEAQFDGLDLLSTAVIVLDQAARIVHANQSAELLLSMSRKNLLGQSAERVIGDEMQMQQLVADARANVFGERRQVLELKRLGREPVPVRVTATAQYGSNNSDCRKRTGNSSATLRTRSRIRWEVCAALPSCWTPSSPRRSSANTRA
jgi:nitrogen fixation/metabolism regulation signal transduction histidine kinase